MSDKRFAHCACIRGLLGLLYSPGGKGRLTGNAKPLRNFAQVRNSIEAGLNIVVLELCTLKRQSASCRSGLLSETLVCLGTAVGLAF